jgi:hypothetical protein
MPGEFDPQHWRDSAEKARARAGQMKDRRAKRRLLGLAAPVAAFGPRMICTGCGIVGADVRLNWQERSSRESLTGVQWR